MILLKFGGITMPKKEEIKSLEEEDEEDPEMDPDESDSDPVSDDDEF
jgi:hypothetical protein